jgi:hypothetical protein
MERVGRLKDRGSTVWQAHYGNGRRIVRNQYGGEGPPLKLVKNEPSTRQHCDEPPTSAD